MHLAIPGQRGPQTRPLLPLPGLPGQGLARGRVHEFCGPAALALAAAVMGQEGATQEGGAVIWIAPGWTNGRLHPPGLAAFADPGRAVFVLTRRPEEALWAMEEALRAGVAPLVIAEMAEPPALTPVRRLHLAAETGAEAARHLRLAAPLGILVTAGDGGAAGIESRWHLSPRPSDPAQAAGGRRLWHLERRRARTAPPAAWTLSREAAGGFASQPAPVGADVGADQGPFTAT